jgi:hypothetical protein
MDRSYSKIIFPKETRLLRMDLSEERVFDKGDTMGYFLEKALPKRRRTHGVGYSRESIHKRGKDVHHS